LSTSVSHMVRCATSMKGRCS